MDPLLRTPTRILSTSNSKLICSEVLGDFLQKWPPPQPKETTLSSTELSLEMAIKHVHMFQYIGISRIRAGRDNIIRQDAELRSTFFGKVRAIPGDIWSSAFETKPGSKLPENQAGILNVILDQCQQYLIADNIISRSGIYGLIQDKDNLDSTIQLVATPDCHRFIASLLAITGLINAFHSEAYASLLTDRASDIFAKALSRLDSTMLFQNTPLSELLRIAVTTTAMIAVPILPRSYIKNLASSPFIHIWTSMIYEYNGPLDCSFLNVSTLSPIKGENIFMGQTTQHLYKQMGYAARVLSLLCRNTTFPLAEHITQRINCYSNELLVQWERSRWYTDHRQTPANPKSNDGNLSPSINQILREYFKAYAFTTMVALDAIAASQLVDDYRIRTQQKSLFSILTLILSTASHLHFITLDVGRDGFEAYQSILRQIMAFLQRPSTDKHLIDPYVRELYSTIPWIRTVVERSNYYPVDQQMVLSYPRMCTILFFMDWVDQLIPNLSEATVSNCVLPISQVFSDTWARHETPELFETSHAVMLGVLDSHGSKLSLAIVPWYAKRLIALYPYSINVDQLRIAFTASVSACTSAGNTDLAWSLIVNLLDVLDPLFDNKSFDSKPDPQANLPSCQVKNSSATTQVTRRELFLVLADQLQALHVSAFPSWRKLIEDRLERETSWGTQRAVLETIQDHVLGRVGAEKKFDASRWIWEMLRKYNLGDMDSNAVSQTPATKL
ncbi:hypothetical protein H4219_004210 [Mycoemilia scoparia]|uniref:Uncharacterized protein n=1 Tax=Mycoemilia scoparia TaxID=417184 RepID=A0A9W7ZYZ5_9FUNG|nr:hypothetical protein H4219_004210 [Mycoemilia scoparia]